MRKALFAISLFLAWPSAAQDWYSTGTCEQAKAEAMLEVGNVRARIFNNGPLFWRGSPFVYEVPAGEGVQSIFAANLMVAGFIDEEVRAAASTYGPYEFWPGPIPQNGEAPTDCSRFDRLWGLDHEVDIRMELQSDTPSAAALEWPADIGAPFVEVNGEAGYQPEYGDYPEMYGDKQVFWIMNDRGNVHNRFDSPPLGIEVQGHAFGFNTVGDIGNTTFYRYRFENKGPKVIRDMGVGLFVDSDLGNFDDDYVGTDTTTSMLYFYNSDNEDEGDDGFGMAPPAVGISIIEATHVDGGLPTDIGAPPGAFASATMWPPGGGGYQGDPGNAQELHNYMIGIWKNGEPQTEGGSGSRFSEIRMPFAYPGDPVTGQFWSEVNVNGAGRSQYPSDRRGYVSFSTFDLAPGEWARVTFAVVWARGTDNLDSVAQLREAARFVHERKAVLLAPRDRGAGRFEDGNPPEPAQFPFWVDEPYPNPASDQVNLRMSLKWSAPVTMEVVDALGRTRIRESFDGIPGPVSRRIQTDGLVPGTYMVRVSQRGEHVDWPLIVL